MNKKRITAWGQACLIGALTIGLFNPVQQFAGIGDGKYPGKCAVISSVACPAESNGRSMKMCFGENVEHEGVKITVPSFALVAFKVDQIGNMPVCKYNGSTGSSRCITAKVPCEWRRLYEKCPNDYQPSPQRISRETETSVPSGDSYCPAYKASGSSADSTDYQK